MSRIAAFLFGLLVFTSSVDAIAASNPANIPAVQTISQLTALGASASQYPVVQVLGYNTAGDGGGGLFRWSSASVATADHCVTFAASGVATGRYIRQLNGLNISVEMCGAYNDGTNAAATRQAFQYANDYVAASATPNAIIEFKGAEYQFGTNGGVVKASSFFCPRWIGGGIGSTSLRLQPTTETAAFTFIGGQGAMCKGSVSGVKILGNSNAIGIEFRGQNGMDFDFEFYSGKMAVLFCNCYSGAFTEQNVGKVFIASMSNGVTNLAEYRISGGNSSFRGSGFAEGTQVSKNVAAANPLIVIGASSQVYNSPLNIKFTNTGGGATSIVRNNSANIASFVSGSLDLETDPADVISIADNAGGKVIFGGSMYTLGAYTGSGIDPRSVILARTHNIGISGVPAYANADGLLTSATFTGSSGVTLSPPFLNNFATYQVTISATGYIWSGTVLAGTDTSGPGTCANPTVVGSILYDNTAGYGAPTVTCTSNAPRFTNGSYPASSMAIVYSVHGQ